MTESGSQAAGRDSRTPPPDRSPLSKNSGDCLKIVSPKHRQLVDAEATNQARADLKARVVRPGGVDAIDERGAFIGGLGDRLRGHASLDDWRNERGGNVVAGLLSRPAGQSHAASFRPVRSSAKRTV